MLPKVAYALPYGHRAAENPNTSMGELHFAMVSYLRERTDAVFDAVALPRRMGMVGRFRRLLTCDADILLLPYPDIPFTAKASILDRVGLLCYWMLHVKARVNSQRIVLCALDLIADQREAFGHGSPGDLERIRHYEGQLLGLADFVVAPSLAFAEHLVDRYRVSPRRVLIMRRSPYARARVAPQAFATARQMDRPKYDWRLLYAGELSRPTERANLEAVIRSLRFTDSAELIVAGPGGQWLHQMTDKNVRYLGILGKADLQSVAHDCHIGLILYDKNPYTDMCSSVKYSLYVTNGLAVAAVNTRTVAENVESDATGFAVSPTVLTDRLLQSLNSPEIITQWRANAKRVGNEIASGKFIEEWLGPLIGSRAQHADCRWDSR